MPKRKREDAASGSAKRNRRDTRLQTAVTDAQKQLQHAFKLAKGLERQKLGKRQKKSRKDEDKATLSRIEAETQACRVRSERRRSCGQLLTQTISQMLEPEMLARSHLRRLIERIKELRSSEELMSLSQTVTRQINDPATLNVTARLYGSNAISAAASKSISMIKQAMGLEKKGGKKEIERRSSAKAPEPMDISEDDDEAGLDQSEFESDEDPDRASDVSAPRAPKDVDLATDDEAGFDELEQRMLGSESDSGSSIDFEKLKSSRQHHAVRDMSITSGSESGSGSENSQDESDEDFSNAESLPARTKAAASKISKPRSKTESAFLPSLAMGGYISGSESEASEVEDVKPRKNRLGQKARQRIWELKYKGNANHIKNAPQDTKKGRDGGWDAKRGATNGSGRGSWKPVWAQGKAQGGSSRHASDANAVSVGNKPGFKKSKPQDDKPLHPSWEAKLKAKEKGEAGMPAFAGTKMTFD